jgi:predicted metal-dependent peptidase
MWGFAELEKLLGMVISANIAINLVQCDTEVKDVKTYTNTKKLKSGLQVKGGGGTNIQPAIDFIKKSKYKSFPILILTDGYTDDLDFGTTPGIVVTTDAEPKVIGKCKIIKLNKE